MGLLGELNEIRPWKQRPQSLPQGRRSHWVSTMMTMVVTMTIMSCGRVKANPATVPFAQDTQSHLGTEIRLPIACVRKVQWVAG